MTMKNNIHDYRVDTDKLFGIYRGVVEDRYDPELLGRCRVRVLGVHDEQLIKDDINGIPTIELPWAEPCYGLSEGMVSGIGNWVVPLQGSYVFVFFENGNWMQPRFFLTAPGLPELPPNPALGFNDPAAEYPKADWILESDVHRLAKVDRLAYTTLTMVKAPKIDLGVEIAIGGTWDEIMPMYQTEYPFNEVHYTSGDIYTEMDNTPGNRRYHIYHPSNSYIEIGETGNMTIRNNETRWDIVMLNRFEHTLSNFHRCVNENRTSKVLMDEYEEIMLNSYRKIHENDRKDVYLTQEYYIVEAEKLYLEGYRTKFIGDSCFEYITTEKTSYVGADVLKYYAANITKLVKGDDTIQVQQERRSWVSEMDLFECDGVIHLKAAEKIILEAPEIEFRADVFNDLAAETNIAGELTWNGVAWGVSILASNAMIANEINVVDYQEFEVVAIAPVAPEVPAPPPEPAAPPVPADIPAPPAPPLPPIYAYIDVPPVEDKC